MRLRAVCALRTPGVRTSGCGTSTSRTGRRSCSCSRPPTSTRSLFQHLLAPLDALVFHDTDRDVSEHQTSILNASLAAALDDDRLLREQGVRTIWASDIEHRAVVASPIPLQRLSWSPHYGQFSTHSDDTVAFRSAAYARFGLPPVSRCPPPQITFLYRHDRRVLNRDELVAWIEAEYRMPVVVATVNETTSSAEQVGLFARTGLMLSSHSSQLMNFFRALLAAGQRCGGGRTRVLQRRLRRVRARYGRLLPVRAGWGGGPQ